MKPRTRARAWEHLHLRRKTADVDDCRRRFALDCVNQLTPKWSAKLAADDVYIWDQCYAMEQSLRFD
jgi:hypothetical protein